MKLDVNTISYLIGTFRNVVDSFGKDSKSVKFYKGQVDGLMSIGQIKNEEANFVYRLLGMENTTAVKWDSTMKRLNNFVEAMQYLTNTTSEEQAYRVYMQLRTMKMIDMAVDNFIRELYDFKDTALPKKKQSFGSFGTPSSITSDARTSGGAVHIGTGYNNKISTGTPAPKVSKGVSSTDKVYTYKEICEINRWLRERLGKLGPDSVMIRVKNSQAVCSSDPSYYTVTLDAFLMNESKDYYLDGVYNELKRCSDYTIGVKKEVGDPCHPTTIIEANQEIMDYMQKVNIINFLELNRRFQGLHISNQNLREPIFNVIRFMVTHKNHMLSTDIDGEEYNWLFSEIFDSSDMWKKAIALKIISLGEQHFEILEPVGPGNYNVSQKLTSQARKLNWKEYFKAALY